MKLRLDRMLIDRPNSAAASPNDAAAVHEVLGGKYGEPHLNAPMDPDHPAAVLKRRG